MLDELDKELERRGHRFVRYADDCNIYVRSQRAGERVMASVERFLDQASEAEGQQGEEAVARPSKRKFLGLQLHEREDSQAAHCAASRLPGSRSRVRELTRADARHKPRADRQRAVASISSDGAATSASARPRRCCAPRPVDQATASMPSSGSNGNAGGPALRSCAAAASAGIWRLKPPAAHTALGGSATAPRSPSLLPNAFFANARPSFPRARSMPLNQPNRRVRTRTHGGVGGEEPRGSPLSRFVPNHSCLTLLIYIMHLEPTFKLKNVSNTICKYPNGAAIQVIAVRFAKPILALSQGDFET